VLWTVFASSFLFVDWLRSREPPLVIHSIRVLTPVVRAGNTVEYEAQYSKRAACYPPKGSGAVRYVFEMLGQVEGSRGARLIYSRGVRRAAWLPGVDLIGPGAAQVPFDMEPGDYEMEAIATYQCEDLPHPSVVKSPKLRIRVLPDIG
jgi:hypothetical protein